MTKWFVKDLSRLTGVSVQTLHHYDRVGLLKPSIRLSNGYRKYSEEGLLRLQQIIALKFFGFELSQIKELIESNSDTVKHFEVQASLLEQKAHKMAEASKALKSIISEVDHKKSIPWETIIKLIEVYNMKQELEHSWVKEIFTPDELNEYAAFESEWKSNSTLEEKEAFEKNWASLVEEINQNIDKSPESEIGISVGRKCMELINGVYGKKYAHLRTKKFERGFGEGLGLDEVGLNTESVAWLDKAIDVYLRDRIYNILGKVGAGASDEKIFLLWKDLLDDMYGKDNSRKSEIYDLVLADKNVSKEAKEWVKNLKLHIKDCQNLL